MVDNFMVTIKVWKKKPTKKSCYDLNDCLVVVEQAIDEWGDFMIESITIKKEG